MKTATLFEATVAAAMTIVLAVGCGATAPPTPSASATPPASTSGAATSRPTASIAATAHLTATPAPTATPVPTATAGTAFVEIEPAATIAVAENPGVIPLVTDGTTLWAAAQFAFLKIDAHTNSVERVNAPVRADNTILALADDGLWATREDSGRLYRLDPQTGQTHLDVAMPQAVQFAFIGKDMWVGLEDSHSMVKVDRLTGVADPATQLLNGAFGVSGMEDLWFVGGAPLRVMRVDPATKAVKASIDFPAESNCSINGTFPDQVWTSCFEQDVRQRSVARIDPTTNTVATVATLPPSHGGAVIPIGDHAWFVGAFDGPDGQPFAGLIRIDPKTGATDRFLSLSGVGPDTPVVAGDALWIPDEASHRILKVNLADLGS